MTDESIFDNSLFKASLLHSDFRGIFENEEEMLAAIDGILNFIGLYLNKRRKDIGNKIFLEKLKVVFSKKFKSVELNTGLFEDTLVINAPAMERPKEKNQKRLDLLSSFLPPVQESKLKTIIFLYSTLTPETRRQLLNKFRRKHKRIKIR